LEAPNQRVLFCLGWAVMHGGTNQAVSLNKKGLVKLMACGPNGEWPDVWEKKYVEVDSRGQLIIWYHPSAKAKHPWEKDLWEKKLGSVVVNEDTNVSDIDSSIKPFCIEIGHPQGGRCRITTISDIDWGQWKISLTGTVQAAIDKKLAATILHFKLRESHVLDIDSKVPMPLDQIPYPCPRMLHLFTVPEEGSFKFEFGNYGEFHLESLEVASLWGYKNRFFFRLYSTDNSAPLFEVELMESDWERFEKIFIKMRCDMSLSVRRDFYSESKKAFWTQFALEQKWRDE